MSIRTPPGGWLRGLCRLARRPHFLAGDGGAELAAGAKDQGPGGGDAYGFLRARVLSRAGLAASGFEDAQAGDVDAGVFAKGGGNDGDASIHDFGNVNFAVSGLLYDGVDDVALFHDDCLDLDSGD